MKNFYAKISILFALCVLLICSCKKNPQVSALEASTWLESKDRADTIIFRGEGSLILNRPRILQGGYLLPKLGAGPYMFQESKDSIGLMYSASSLYKFHKYPFKIDNNTLYIGDFYNNSGKLLVFKKIK